MRTLCGLIVVVLLLAMPVAVFAATTYELVAGNPKNGVYKVGTVVVSEVVVNSTTYLHIQFSTDAPWELTATHVHVEADGNNLAYALDQVPHSKGGPTPGQFDYDENSPEYKGEGLYVIPSPGENVIILAHGVACENLTGLMPPPWLPDTVQVCVRLLQDEGYLEIKVDGTTYPGYCADRNLDIPIGGVGGTWVCYSAEVFSSYDLPNLPPGLIDYPENLDLVNYMLNEHPVGQTCPDSDIGGEFLYGDLQLAKWKILETSVAEPPYTIPEGDYDPDRVAWLVEDAFDNGEGYEPGCGDKIDILLYPIDPDDPEKYVQPLEILIPIECDCDTAWAGTVNSYDPPDVDYPYPGKNWALYVMYTMGQPAPPRMSLNSSVTTTWGSIKNR